MRRCSPDPLGPSSPDSPIREVHLIPRRSSRDPRTHRFDAVAAAFVADGRARNLSPRTIEFYLEGLTGFRTFAGGADGSLTLAALELTLARAWLADLAARGRRPATVAARARSLRVFSRWASDESYVRADPLARLRVPAVPRSVVATFTEEQLRDLLAAAPPHLAIALRILIDTGLRVSELTGLCLASVGDGQLRVRGKGGHERAVPYGRALDAALRRYLARERPPLLGRPDDRLLLGRDGRPLTPESVYQGMRRLGRRLGIEGVRVSPHTCRHTFAIAFLRNSGGVFALQKILGHTDLAMVRRYAELAEGDVAADHAIASPLDHLSGMPRALLRPAQPGLRRRNGASASSGEYR